MDHRTTGRSGQTDGDDYASAGRPADPYRAFSEQAHRAWNHEQRRADRLERNRTLVLLGIGAAVVFGVFEVVGSPTGVGRTASVALGSVALGLVALGSAALPLLGLSPRVAPSPPPGSLRNAVLRAFFSGLRDSRSGRSTDRGAVGGGDPSEVLDRADDFPVPAPATISGAHRSTMRASVRAAREVRDENRRRERHLGWARLGIALGLTFLLAGGVLSLSPYAGAVLLALGGGTGLWLVR